MSSIFYPLMVILVATLATMLTRFIPFLVFGTKRPVPQAIRYLGIALPAAIMATLIIYCLKDITLLSGTHGLPELIGISLTAALHVWKRNTFLSITCGTAIYMILIHFVFI